MRKIVWEGTGDSTPLGEPHWSDAPKWPNVNVVEFSPEGIIDRIITGARFMATTRVGSGAVRRGHGGTRERALRDLHRKIKTGPRVRGFVVVNLEDVE